MGNRSSHKVYSDERIITVVRVNVKKKSTKTRPEDVEDIYLLKLGVESYQRTLNLTKPKFYFPGIDQKIPYTTSRTKKGVVYINQHNMKSLMKLDEVHKFYDGNLLKVQDNLLEM
ncbi:hypothetical protein Tco_1216806 [Tanacetum coccineum]